MVHTLCRQIDDSGCVVALRQLRLTAGTAPVILAVGYRVVALSGVRPLESQLEGVGGQLRVSEDSSLQRLGGKAALDARLAEALGFRL
jgi:hypothetical protein